MNFAKSLKKELDARGWSAYKFHKTTGISQQTLSKLLNGESAYPTLPTFIDISKGLGLKPWAFLKKILENS